jgi:hypothetical protein
VVSLRSTTGYKLGCFQHPKAIKACIGLSSFIEPADLHPPLIGDNGASFPSLTLPALKEHVSKSERLSSEGFLFSTSSSYFEVSNNCLST